MGDTSSSLRLQRKPEKRRKKHHKNRTGNRVPQIIITVLLAIAIVVFVLLCVYVRETPKMQLIGQDTVTTAQGEEYIDEGATATFHGEDISGRIRTTDNVDTSQVGTYEVVYTAEGKRRSASITRMVEVTDQTAPEITLNGEPVVIVDDIEEYADPGATATDNCDGDLSYNITTNLEQVNDYTWNETYTVTDEANNEGTAIREVQLRDDVLPEITLNGGETITIDQNTAFEDPGVTVADNRDGDISDAVIVSGEVDTYRSGEYTLTYTVEDSSGNEASVSRTVVVESAPVTDASTIYLTFDDGPSELVTPQILDILKENDIKATFFIVNYDEEEIPILQRAIEEGHTIGIHGYSHDYAEIYTSVDAFMNNIYKLSDKLSEDTGYDAFVIRFPGGSSNTISSHYSQGVMTQLVATVDASGLMYMDWNVSAGDGAEGITSEDVINNVLGGLETDRENVVLMHDSTTHQTTADALQTVIDYGKENGYSFYPITRETEPIHHEVFN